MPKPLYIDVFATEKLYHTYFPRKMLQEIIVEILSLRRTFLIQATTPMQGVESGVKELRGNIVKWVLCTLEWNYPYESQYHVNKYMPVEIIKNILKYFTSQENSNQVGKMSLS